MVVPQQWAGEPAVIAATGPSLTQEDVDYVRGKARLICVNSAVILASWADAVYSADQRWWDHHDGLPGFRGQKWTQSDWENRDAGTPWGLSVVQHRKGCGLCRDPEAINGGGMGGYQALGLAYHFGCNPIYLLGYDMTMNGGKTHFFGDYPPPMNVRLILDNYVSVYGPMAKDLRDDGIQVVNCSVSTKLHTFPQRRLADVL